ncbi:MAG: AmmeMemoRadiSam system radical SAM enzyme [Thermoplasmataceae archaeon]|jgi:pyruvate formate lyase activating enzyme
MNYHPADLYENVDSGKIRCTACSRYCILSEGQRGFCGVRFNDSGILILSAYGNPMAIHIDPIEKKPVLHAIPNSRILSLGTNGCNYACKYCQNWDLSQTRETGTSNYSPEMIVAIAVKEQTRGIAFTYNEPTIFVEYAMDIARIARKKNLKTIFVTNGSESQEAVRYIDGLLDFATIDFKGNGSVEFYRRFISMPTSDGIFLTIERMIKAGIHVEITDLVVPEVGDSLPEARKMLTRIIDIAGYEIPVSFLRFHPDYKMNNLPVTPLETLVAHRNLALDLGIKFVYLGNVPGSGYEDTTCPGCGNIVARRLGFRTYDVHVDKNGKCEFCGYNLHFIMN